MAQATSHVLCLINLKPYHLLKLHAMGYTLFL